MTTYFTARIRLAALIVVPGALSGTPTSVMRGGSWSDPENRTRVSARASEGPSIGNLDSGFRIVRGPLVTPITPGSASDRQLPLTQKP